MKSLWPFLCGNASGVCLFIGGARIALGAPNFLAETLPFFGISLLAAIAAHADRP